jgi:peroxiredoxin
LSDIGNKVAKYGIVFKLTDAVADTYQKVWFTWFGDADRWVAIAATYVIDQRKNCVYVLDAEYRNRAEAKDILAALDSHKK